MPRTRTGKNSAENVAPPPPPSPPRAAPAPVVAVSGEVAAILAAASKTDAQLAELPNDDPEFVKKAFRINCMRFRDVEEIWERFPWPEELEEHDGVPTWHNKPVVSRDIVSDVIAAEYAEVGVGSIGRDKLYSHMRQRYWCVILPVVNAFLQSNTESQVHRQRRRSQASRAFVAAYAAQRLFVDCTDINRGPITFLLTMADAFSKKIWCGAGRTKSAELVARIFEKGLEQFVKIENIRCDNGGEVTGAPFKDMLARHNIVQTFTSSHSPTQNALAETANRIIKTYLTSAEGQIDGTQRPASFAVALSKALRAYNNSQHDATGFTPNQLHTTDIPPRLLVAIRARLRERAGGARPNDKYQPPLAPGDKVRLDVLEIDHQKAAAMKSGMYKASHFETWSRETYTVKRHNTTSNTVTLNEDVEVAHGDDKPSGYSFQRGRVQKV
jgi:transposase InsO family protein